MRTRSALHFILFSCFFMQAGIAVVLAQLPQVASGSLRRFEKFPSAYVTARTLDVWLPPGYDSTHRYAVLYMHDGQMLYDSTTTWNHQEWKVDETAGKLIAENKIQPCIIVGIWNGGASRHSDYFPEKPLNYLPKALKDTISNQELQGRPQADHYLKFLVTEVKPFIDHKFATFTDARHTFVAGSSMGGLISLYAICEYPKVFGGAACMSTHWVGSLKQKNELIPAAFNTYLQNHLPSPRHHRLYFDYGSETLDSLYKPYQLLIDKTLKQKGYTARNWTTLEFVGENHSEKSWSKRLDIPFVFLLGKRDL